MSLYKLHQTKYFDKQKKKNSTWILPRILPTFCLNIAQILLELDTIGNSPPHPPPLIPVATEFKGLPMATEFNWIQGVTYGNWIQGVTYGNWIQLNSRGYLWQLRGLPMATEFKG